MNKQLILIVFLGLYSVKSSMARISGFGILESPLVWFCFQIIFVAYFVNLTFRLIRSRKIEKLGYIYLYLIFIVCVIFRGGVIANSYWDWKLLYENFFGLLMPVFVIGLIGNRELRNFLLSFLPYALFFFLLIAFFINYDNYGFYFAPLSLLILFSPAIRINQQILIFGVSFLVILVDLTARSNVIKIVIPFFLLAMHNLNTRVVNLIARTLHAAFIISPIALMSIAALNEVNVFDIQSNLGYSFDWKSNSEMAEEDLLMDTRSFMFVESFLTADEFNSWVFGRTPIHGQISPSYAEFDQNGRDERVVNESAIINIFNWSGLVGVFIYFTIFLISSSLAVYKSNNIYIKTIGIFISFRWLYGWVEDVNIFNLSYFILWLILIIPLSKEFRVMSDEDVKLWLKKY